jgi:YwiC-like protein
MIPREHGAYGQLLVPALTAMAIGRPSAAAVALAAAAVAVFVAHEPLLVRLGRRGERVRRDEGGRAMRWLLASSAIALPAGAVGTLMLPAGGRWALLVPVALACVAALSIVAGRERTAPGEIVAASALASVSFPVAVASSATVEAALACTLAFITGFIAATLGVRVVVRRAQRRVDAGRRVAISTIAAIVAGLTVLAMSRIVLAAAMWAAAPVCVVALALAIVVPPPRYLRQIGWTLVAATALTGVILVAAVR